jgi:hypothetical protein
MTSSARAKYALASGWIALGSYSLCFEHKQKYLQRLQSSLS